MRESSVCTFLDVVPDYDIVDGNMRISTGGDWCICMSLRNFERGMARAQRVIDAHRGKRAEVVPFRHSAT